MGMACAMASLESISCGLFQGPPLEFALDEFSGFVTIRVGLGFVSMRSREAGIQGKQSRLVLNIM